MRPQRFTARHLIEIIIFITLILTTNLYSFGAEPGYYGWNLNPFWAAVLLFSLRYGFMAGLVSGSLSSASYLGLCYFARDQGQSIIDRYLFEDPDFYVLPTSFVVVGSLIGWIISARDQQAADFQEERDELARAEAPLKTEISTLHDINLALEKKIVTQMSTLVTMYEGARLLENQDLNSILDSINRFFSKVLGVEASELFQITDGKLVLRDSWSAVGEGGGSAADDDLEQDMARMAMTRKRIVSLRDYMQSGTLAQYKGKTLIAGPICSGENGDVIAVYCVKKIRLEEINSSFINALAFLTGWASRAIAKAREVRTLRDNAIIDEAFNVFTASYFRHRCEEEFSRSKKYYLPLSFARIQLVGIETMPQIRQRNWMTAAVRIFKSSFREMDVIGFHDDNAKEFGILMVTCSPEQAEGMVERVRKSMSDLGLGGDVHLDINLKHFNPRMTAFDEMRPPHA